MTAFIYRSMHFHNVLDRLRSAGGKSALVANRVEKILHAISTDRESVPERIHTLSRHGEARIPNCRKYDLGGGYRLIYVKKGNHLVFLYAGTHDDCDRWIGNHRGLDPSPETDCRPVTAQRQREGLPGDTEPGAGQNMDGDALFMRPIEDEILRKIFPGLCKA